MLDSKGEKAIITPPIDAICSGGLSLVVALAIILYGWLTQTGMNQLLVAIELYLLTDLLINWPHFMASYRLLYGKRKNLSKHPVVTLVLPLIALAFVGYVIYVCLQTSPGETVRSIPILGGLEWAAPVFLAWHYTGQAWGMTACFAFLSGLRMTGVERRLIRSGFYALCAYHIIWAYDSMGFVAQALPANDLGYYLMQLAMSAGRVAVFVTFVLGLYGFRLLSRREGNVIPVRMWLPWLATFSWYVMVDVHPASFFLLQAFHALQYLSFPFRVEINQFSVARWRWLHLSAYYVILVILGLVAFDWHEIFFEMSDAHMPIVTATVIAINLHHYFIDAVIWKIRDPEVRQSLFAHIAPAST